jgi:hypothetical protein
MIFELELNVAVGSALTHQLDTNDLHFSGLVFLQGFLVDVPQECLFIVLQGFIIFVLDRNRGTR